MTENQKFWLEQLYLEAAEDHRDTANNEHLCAMGAPTAEAAMLHEGNAREHRMFAIKLEQMARQVKEEIPNMTPIEEMAKYCCYPCEMEHCGECIEGNNPCKCHIALTTAEALYKAGYRKQEDTIEVK